MTLAAVAVPAPAQQGANPGRVEHAVRASGTVIAIADRCVQIKVDDVRGVAAVAGRVWVCDPHSTPGNLGAYVTVRGRVTGSRLTMIGGTWRQVPVVTASAACAASAHHGCNRHDADAGSPPG